MRRNFLKTIGLAIAGLAATSRPAVAQERSAVGRFELSGPLTLYVDAANGVNDASGQMPVKPFRTIMAAVRFIQSRIDCCAWPVTIQCADSAISYDAFQCYNPVVGYNQIFVVGNEANPSACKIEVAAGACVAARDLGIVTVKGFKLSATGPGCFGIHASQLGVVDFASCEFGQFSGGYHIVATELGNVNSLGGYVVSGSAKAHLLVSEKGRIKMNPAAVSIPNVLTFTEAWANSIDGSIVYNGASTFSGAGSGFGSIGQKYAATMNGTIMFFSSTPPGNAGGATASGGQVAG